MRHPQKGHDRDKINFVKCWKTCKNIFGSDCCWHHTEMVSIVCCMLCYQIIIIPIFIRWHRCCTVCWGRWPSPAPASPSAPGCPARPPPAPGRPPPLNQNMVENWDLCLASSMMWGCTNIGEDVPQPLHHPVPLVLLHVHQDHLQQRLEPVLGNVGSQRSAHCPAQRQSHGPQHQTPWHQRLSAVCHYAD